MNEIPDHTCFIEEKTGKCIHCGWQPIEQMNDLLRDWTGPIYLDCDCFGSRQTRLSESEIE